MSYEFKQGDNLDKQQYVKPIEEWTLEEQIEYWNKQIDIADARRAHAVKMLSNIAIGESNA